MDHILKAVEEFAAKAHDGQTRKYSPEQYIAHPVRVMNICREYTSDQPILAAALLHDVLEDTKTTDKDLQHFLNTIMPEQEVQRTVQLVKELTDVYVKKQFPKWNRRKRKAKEEQRIEATSGDSQTIKYADIIDNCKEIAEADPDFANTFLRECYSLLKHMPKGNQQLYRRAIDEVNKSIGRLKQTRNV